MAVDDGLAAAHVDREHRDKADRDEHEAGLRGGDHGRGEREQAARGPGLEQEVVAHVASDRLPRQERAAGARERVVDDEERDAPASTAGSSAPSIRGSGSVPSTTSTAAAAAIASAY